MRVAILEASTLRRVSGGKSPWGTVLEIVPLRFPTPSPSIQMGRCGSRNICAVLSENTILPRTFSLSIRFHLLSLTRFSSRRRGGPDLDPTVWYGSQTCRTGKLGTLTPAFRYHSQ